MKRFPDPTVIERNIRTYRQLNEIDDRREKSLKAASTGRHEPSAMFDGLYDVEEIDDGGRLVERHERGIEAAFVPVSELPSSSKRLPFAPTGKKQVDANASAAPVSSAKRPSVLIRRRGSTLHAL